MNRKGFTFVAVVAFMGTLALGLAMVQTDTAVGAFRHAAHASAHLRARVAGSTLAAALDTGATATVEWPGAKATAEAERVRVEMRLRGAGFEVIIPR